jgi:hypothetical protein
LTFVNIYAKIKEKRKEINTMEINSILQAVSTVGFPIAMCLICSYYIVNLNKEHKEETEKLTEALNNNTLVLQKLCDTIGVEREV